MIKTVFFDLDDTIFDHKYARLCALYKLRRTVPSIGGVPIDEMEKAHERLLLENYPKVLNGTLSYFESTLQRMSRLFLLYGIKLSDEDIYKYTNLYKTAYAKNRRAVPGVLRLIRLLKKTYKIGVISNGAYAVQTEKLRICRAESYIDILVLSEETGIRKPEKGIFISALDKSGSKANEAVFIGDSWKADIIGAANCGIKTIWLNRYNEACPDNSLAFEINSYENTGKIRKFIKSQQ